jgi:hypothetical protein
MSTLSDFFGGNNKIGVNGSGKQVSYAMCSNNTSSGQGGFVFFDEDFRLISAQGIPGAADSGASVPHNVFMSNNTMQYLASVFSGANGTENTTSSNGSNAYLSGVNASGEFGNAMISVYSDGTYENPSGMANNTYNKHYLNSYAINSDHSNKRNVYILNGGAINVIDKLSATYNYPKIDTSSYVISGLNTSMQGSASYNRARKELVIISNVTTSGSFNCYTYSNLDFDTYENPKLAFAAGGVARVDATLSLAASWAVNNNEAYFNLKPILCDNGDVYVSVMFGSNSQKLYKFTRNGTAAITASMIVSQTLTTSYGLDQAFQFGQRQITSRDGTTVAVFCPYYYYGTGNSTFMINKTNATYMGYLNTGTGSGHQVLPYKNNGWAFVFTGNGYAGNAQGNYIAAIYLKSTDAAGSFSQIGATKYFPAHTYPNTTNYPGFTQVVDYNLLTQNLRLFK